jgi:hypothetical protein
VLQASLRDKTKQLKAMASELNMYQAQVGVSLHPASHHHHHHHHPASVVERAARSSERPHMFNGESACQQQYHDPCWCLVVPL